MGREVRVQCLDSCCNYSKELRYQPGWVGIARLGHFREELLAGEEDYPEAVEILQNGGELQSHGVYLCPKCKEHVTSKAFYCITYVSEAFEEYTYDGVEEDIYDVAFPFGIPKCDNCGTDLQYIDEDFFDSIKCPKCGGKALFEEYGLYD